MGFGSGVKKLTKTATEKAPQKVAEQAPASSSAPAPSKKKKAGKGGPVAAKNVLKDPWKKEDPDGDEAYAEAGVAKVSGDMGIDRMLQNRPGYGTAITSADGKLNKQVRLEQQASNLDGLKSMMRGAGKAGAEDVSKKGRDVNAGEDFAGARDNVNRLEQRAWGTGPSEWAKARSQQATQQYGEARGQQAKDASRNLQTGFNQMAQQGGLDAASRERMRASSNKSQIMAGQGLARQNMMTQTGITADDEAQRMQLQQQMPGMRMNLDSYNTGLQNQNVNRQVGIDQFNSQQDLQAQGMNQDLAMKKANLWGNMADAESGRNQQVGVFNKQTQIGDINNRSADAQQGWQSGLDAYAAVESSKAQAQAARASKPKGGLLGLGG